MTFIQYPRIRRIRPAQVHARYVPQKPSTPAALVLGLAGIAGLFFATALIAAGLFVVYLAVSNLF